MNRLFIAIWPTEAVADGLHSLDVPAEPGVRLVAPENWHITLRFLGDADPDTVAARLRATALPGASAAIGPAVERLGRGQLVIPVSGVDDLAAAVGEATADLGEPPRHRFSGHLTVARTKRDARSATVGHTFAAEFDVTEIALVASDLTPSGAIYRTVATFDVG